MEVDALQELPEAQYHAFETWAVDPEVCARCGQLPQAHPLDGDDDE